MAAMIFFKGKDILMSLNLVQGKGKKLQTFLASSRFADASFCSIKQVLFVYRTLDDWVLALPIPLERQHQPTSAAISGWRFRGPFPTKLFRAMVAGEGSRRETRRGPQRPTRGTRSPLLLAAPTGSRSSPEAPGGRSRFGKPAPSLHMHSRRFGTPRC